MGAMRAVLAAVACAVLLVTAAGTHVHTGPHGRHDCAVCVAGSGDVARTDPPELAPRAIPLGEAARAPGLAPVTGAPLGAVPGQSPPAA